VQAPVPSSTPAVVTAEGPAASPVATSVTVDTGTAPSAAAETLVPVTGVAAATVAVSAAADAHCKNVAQQRKRDAAANDYDDSMQQTIFDGTYKNCIDWASAHRN